MKKEKILVALLIFTFGFCPALWAKERFNYQAYTLKNGLQVIILANTRAPVVYHSLWYKVGSADSPTHKTGLAHFLEHMMFKGSQQFPGDTYKRTINDLGGEQNANTTWDRTVYFVTLAKEYLPILMEMEADRMQHLSIHPEEVEKEKAVVLQERRSTSDAQAHELVAEAANSSFFWEHPYGQPVIGFEEHIRQYTAEDARQFYKTWYVPNNAVLILAGDVDPVQVKPLIEKYYGSIPAGNPICRQRPVEPNHRETTAKVEIRSPQVGPSFQRIYRAPNHRTSDLRKEASLTLLQDIFGDPTFGRLNQTLVENQKLANSVSAHYTGHFYDPFSFTISAGAINSSDLTWLEANVEAETRRIINEGVTSSELAKAKEQWQASVLYRQDSLHGLANYFGENLAAGYTLADIESWMDTIHQITSEEIKTVAKEVLGKNPDVILYTHHVAQK